jgi:hypothetical protein
MKYFEKDANFIKKLLGRTKKPITGSVIMPSTTASSRIGGKAPAVGTTKAPGPLVTPTTPTTPAIPTIAPKKNSNLKLVGAAGLGLGTGLAAGSMLDLERKY